MRRRTLTKLAIAAVAVAVATPVAILLWSGIQHQATRANNVVVERLSLAPPAYFNLTMEDIEQMPSGVRAIFREAVLNGTARGRIPSSEVRPFLDFIVTRDLAETGGTTHTFQLDGKFYEYSFSQPD